MADIIKLDLKFIREGRGVLAELNNEDSQDVLHYITNKFVHDVRKGLEGEIGYKDSPFFEVVDKIYEEYKVRGCYFCDHDIDGNAVPFDYPKTTKICLSCQLKIANLLVAFGINPKGIFPGIGERKLQKMHYKRIDENTSVSIKEEPGYPDKKTFH